MSRTANRAPRIPQQGAMQRVHCESCLTTTNRSNPNVSISSIFQQRPGCCQRARCCDRSCPCGGGQRNCKSFRQRLVSFRDVIALSTRLEEELVRNEVRGEDRFCKLKGKKVVPEVGLERRQAIDNTQVIDFINATIATISWFGGKLVRIEYTARVNFRVCTSLHTASLRRFADKTTKVDCFRVRDNPGAIRLARFQ